MSTKPRIYSDDWKVPTSFGLWGGSRAAQTQLALAIARRVDPEFYWLQIVGDPGSHNTPEVSLSERVPSGHLFYLRPDQLAPRTPSGKVADLFVRSDLEADARLRQIGDFLRLPSLARNLLAGRSANSPTIALVIPESNLAEQILPLEEGGIRPFIEAINQYGVTLLTTLSNRPNPNARDIDYLLFLRPGSEVDGLQSDVECQQGPPSGSRGLFTQGKTWRLNALVAELRQVRPGPPQE